MSEQTTPTTDTQSVTPTQLQLADLLICAQAIQVASQRGAFRAEEFTQIGGTFDRITAFLKENGLLKAPEPSSETDQPASAE
jgi:hypothetical protein